jgi:hypothetical protein
MVDAEVSEVLDRYCLDRIGWLEAKNPGVEVHARSILASVTTLMQPEYSTMTRWVVWCYRLAQ